LSGTSAAHEGAQPTRATDQQGALRPLRAQLERLPLLARPGLVVLIAGVLLDLLAPALGGGHASHHTGSGQFGHLMAMAGMTTTLAGVVIDGARRQVRPRTADTQSKEKSDAIR
jgi:hypothetical protein